jgi:hypothetical protein
MILLRVELAEQGERNDMSTTVTFEPKKTRKELVISSVVGGVILIVGVGACGGVQSGTATSAGPAVSPSTASTTADKKVTVPVLTGLTVKQATSKLAASGLSIAVTGDTSDPKFVVLSQSTAAGDPKEGDTVTVVIGESEAQKTAREAAEAQAALAAQQEAERQAAAQAAAAADADLSTYTDIDDRTWQLVAKDPNAHIGEKYVIYGGVTQFDSATGTSGFRANTGGERDDSSNVSVYSYDINTIVTGDPTALKQVVENDLLKMYVKVTGAYTYDTSIGGSATAPKVSLTSFELIGHDD